MPRYRVVYEDTAPFFTYAGAWRAGSSADDKSAEKYSESSFTVTEALGASFSFMFYGTEVSIFGSRRSNHGQYQVSLDGVTSPTQTGASTADEFSATLWAATTGKALHNVTLTNKENKFLDVDSVSWTASVGNDDEPLIVNTWQDSHPNFQYSPLDAWTTSLSNSGTFSGASGHATSTAGATAQVTFKVRLFTVLIVSRPDRSRPSGSECDAIAVYGPAGPTGPASYSVQVDSQAPSRYSGIKQFQRSRQLLYYGGNFGQGTHTLTLKLESVSDRAQVLAVDYVEVYTTPSLGGSFDISPGSAAPPTGLIAGVAILGAIAFLALGFLAYIYYLYKKRRLDFVDPKKSSEPEYPDMQTFQGTVGYQPTITSPISNYPTTEYAYSGVQPTYPSAAPRTMATAGNAPSVGYYQPSQSAMTDSTSMASGSASNSTNPRTTGVAPSRSIRKNRLQPQDEEPSTTPIPPPAYMDA